MMQLGKGMKVLPLPKQIETLKEEFIPQVQSRCTELEGSLDLTFDVKFIEHVPAVDMMMYHLTITAVSAWEGKREPTLFEIQTLCKALDCFTHNDDGPFVYSERTWILGDGDDELATFFKDGKFCIWLRGWAKEAE